jgi:hypothetical protein
MFDEPRSHDPNPTAEELEWMATNPLPVAARVAAMTALAVLLGVAASQTVDWEPTPVAAVAASR